MCRVEHHQTSLRKLSALSVAWALPSRPTRSRIGAASRSGCQGSSPASRPCPPAPGWSLITTAYYYNGNADKAKAFQIGDTLVAGVKSTVPMLLFQLGYAPEDKILGGQPYIGLGWGPGKNRTSVDLTLSQPGIERTRSDSVTGGTDLYPYASLAWANGDNNWMT